MNIRRGLMWLALAAILVVTSTAEFAAAEAVGMPAEIAWAVPVAIDTYVVLAVMGSLDVVPALILLWLTVSTGMVHRASEEAGVGRGEYALAVVLASILTLVLWRIHAVAEAIDQQLAQAAQNKLADERALTEEKFQIDRRRVEQEFLDRERAAEIEQRHRDNHVLLPVTSVKSKSAPKKSRPEPTEKKPTPTREEAREILLRMDDMELVTNTKLAEDFGGSDVFWSQRKKAMREELTVGLS